MFSGTKFNEIPSLCPFGIQVSLAYESKKRQLKNFAIRFQIFGEILNSIQFHDYLRFH